MNGRVAVYAMPQHGRPTEIEDIPAPASEPGPAPDLGAWPLGINLEMDRHAANVGLAHWSCVSPNTNRRWVRKDGRRCEPRFSGPNGNYIDDLRAVDLQHPMAEVPT
jgi:hypothetical protein